MLDGKSLTIYANIKGGTAPIPVEYYETVSKVTMSNKNTLPVSVNGRPYYVGFYIVIIGIIDAGGKELPKAVG